MCEWLCARARALEVALPPQPNESPICCAAIQFYYSNLTNSSRESISGKQITLTEQGHDTLRLLEVKEKSIHSTSLLVLPLVLVLLLLLLLLPLQILLKLLLQMLPKRKSINYCAKNIKFSEYELLTAIKDFDRTIVHAKNHIFSPAVL